MAGFHFLLFLLNSFFVVYSPPTLFFNSYLSHAPGMAVWGNIKGGIFNVKWAGEGGRREEGGVVGK